MEEATHPAEAWIEAVGILVAGRRPVRLYTAGLVEDGALGRDAVWIMADPAEGFVGDQVLGE
jgi:hypothetical protein